MIHEVSICTFIDLTNNRILFHVVTQIYLNLDSCTVVNIQALIYISVNFIKHRKICFIHNVSIHAKSVTFQPK